MSVFMILSRWDPEKCLTGVNSASLALEPNFFNIDDLSW